MIDAAIYKQVMGSFPSGVTVITTLDDDGQIVGLTASAFSSLSMDPALVLFCPNYSSDSYPVLIKNKRFAIHVLSGGQQRRMALLRALLCQPVQTLLLDEPFTGMDPELVSHAAAAVVRLAARRDTVLVTHDEHAADLLGWPVVRLETVGK